MTKVFAFIVARPLADPTEVVRAMIVVSCALALILAGPVRYGLGL
jgi:hypothetical protein